MLDTDGNDMFPFSELLPVYLVGSTTLIITAMNKEQDWKIFFFCIRTENIEIQAVFTPFCFSYGSLNGDRSRFGRIEDTIPGLDVCRRFPAFCSPVRNSLPD